jgi:nitrite reductase/ring-hydroxylating ferredoxin subunit
MFVDSGLKRSDVQQAGMKLVRKNGRQVLLIASGGKLFAIANRCPHEGYPLSEGTLGSDCVLTCNWHNWKFDLKSGNALIGRDPVRTYPIETRGDEIFLDLTDPPAEQQRERALKGLDAGIADNDFARVAREVARLERAGFDAREAIAHAFIANNDRHEGGMSHAHAAGADWLAMADGAPNEDARLAALLEPIMHLAWDIAGVGTFPYAERVERWDAAAFLAAMEVENEELAIAHIRGAIADRIPYANLQPVLGEAALAHYADFGHNAIYALKAGQFIERLGENTREAVLLAHVRQLVQARREERLPEFRLYARALEGWSAGRNSAISQESFAGANVEHALRHLLDSSGRDPRELFDAVLGAAGWNMLHFNLAFDQATENAIADNVNWLDFTHALTFANAARHLCEERPDLWPKALLQLALFVGRNAGYVDAKLSTREWEVSDSLDFVAREKLKLYDHGIVEPIIAYHRLKVLFALEDELTASPDAPWVKTICAAVNRYLNSPTKRHHGLRQAAQARDFIAREG